MSFIKSLLNLFEAIFKFIDSKLFLILSLIGFSQSNTSSDWSIVLALFVVGVSSHGMCFKNLADNV